MGNQTGGRVFLFLNTDDFWRDYTEMVAKGIRFVRPPKEEVYGLVGVFEDLYGNLWDLLQLNADHPISQSAQSGNQDFYFKEQRYVNLCRPSRCRVSLAR